MIAEELQAQLRAKFNPDGSDLRKMQLRMLEMLKYIDKICRENNIKYWLSSGTCLGAVRHGGFIPWDDDVDIELLEDDYNRLIDILRKNETGDFAIQTHKDDPEYTHEFAKLRDKTTKISERYGIDQNYKYQGIYIDIFRILPSNSNIIHFFCGRIRVIEFHLKRLSLKMSVLKLLYHGVRSFNNIIISFLRPIDNFRQKDRLRHPLGVPFLKPRSLKDIGDTIRIPFEDSEFPVPSLYDNYLHTIFGDYSKLIIGHKHFQENNSR